VPVPIGPALAIVGIPVDWEEGITAGAQAEVTVSVQWALVWDVDLTGAVWDMEDNQSGFIFLLFVLCLSVFLLLDFGVAYLSIMHHNA